MTGNAHTKLLRSIYNITHVAIYASLHSVPLFCNTLINFFTPSKTCLEAISSRYIRTLWDCVTQHDPTHHEAEQTSEDSSHRPGWVPGVRMEVTNGETEPCVGLEAAIGSDHHDPRWLEWVILGEHQLA